MNSSLIWQSTLRVGSDQTPYGPGSVGLCCLSPDFLALLRSNSRMGDLMRLIFRVRVAEATSDDAEFPDVSGQYLLIEDEVRFFPHFPFESDLKYRFSFDPRPLDLSLALEPFDLEFMTASEEKKDAWTAVTSIFPSGDFLPENLLRFYVCFSEAMQRGRAANEIRLLDSDGIPVPDALYRAPVELWDRSIRRLTVLLDPGRLKRWVGPNVELGPPLKAGHEYTLEIGQGLSDQHNRPLRERFRKHFVAGDPARAALSVSSWRILPPRAGSRQALELLFTGSMDWAMLFNSVTVLRADGSVVDGQIEVDKCETRW